MKSSPKDEESIRKVVSMYFTGTYHGKPEELKRAFHPNARIVGIINDTMTGS